jgi:hypothetical protein
MSDEHNFDNFKFISGYFIVTDPLDYENKKIIVPYPFVKHTIRYVLDKNGNILAIGTGKKKVYIGDTIKMDIEPGVLPDITPGGEYRIIDYKTRDEKVLEQDYDTRRVRETDIEYGGRRSRKRSHRKSKHNKSKRSKSRRHKRTRRR